jgi:hypothetical protein
MHKRAYKHVVQWHFDADTHALREQGTYWRRNLARLVTANLGIQLSSVTHFEERDQTGTLTGIDV